MLPLWTESLYQVSSQSLILRWPSILKKLLFLSFPSSHPFPSSFSSDSWWASWFFRTLFATSPRLDLWSLLFSISPFLQRTGRKLSRQLSYMQPQRLWVLTQILQRMSKEDLTISTFLVLRHCKSEMVPSVTYSTPWRLRCWSLHLRCWRLWVFL